MASRRTRVSCAARRAASMASRAVVHALLGFQALLVERAQLGLRIFERAARGRQLGLHLETARQRVVEARLRARRSAHRRWRAPLPVRAHAARAARAAPSCAEADAIELSVERRDSMRSSRSRAATCAAWAADAAVRHRLAALFALVLELRPARVELAQQDRPRSSSARARASASWPRPSRCATSAASSSRRSRRSVDSCARARVASSWPSRSAWWRCAPWMPACAWSRSAPRGTRSGEPRRVRFHLFARSSAMATVAAQRLQTMLALDDAA